MWAYKHEIDYLNKIQKTQKFFYKDDTHQLVTKPLYI